MERKIIFPVVLVFTLILAACGNGNIDDPKEPVIEENVSGNNAGSTDTVEDAESTEGTKNTGSTDSADNMQQKMEDLAYSDFELAVDYANDLEYEVELERSSNNAVKAEIEDDLNNVRKSGAEAFDDLYPLVEKLTITQETNKADAIQEVLNTFNLADDYQEFELEIKFNDGTKLEFEDKK